MATRKETMEEQPKDLWTQQLVKPISLSQYAQEVQNTEKIIAFGESNTGKTTLYLGVLPYYQKLGVTPELMKMVIITPDRPTGITKLYNEVPKEYRDFSVEILPVNNYEELVSSTATAERILKEHYKKTGKYGWLVGELLEDAWKSAQDYYCRLAYGESLGEYFAKKRADVKAMKDDNTAYKALEGWGDWPIIKYFHNYNWIDKIKRMPYNILFTAEIKEEGNKDSIFFDLGYRPGGEKDNIHRFDTVLYLSHKENNFFIKSYKLTGYKRLYGQIDVTGKNPFEEHKKALKRLEQLGYRTTSLEELEKEAGITPPKPPEQKPVVEQTTSEKPVEKPKETKKDEWDI